MQEYEQNNGSSFLSTVLTLVVVVVGSIWAYNHLFESDTWSLLYESDMGTVAKAGDYPTREECEAKLYIARTNPTMSRPECGSNCEPPSTINGPYVCEETFEL